MVKSLYFIIIYTILLFIWSYVFANSKREDKVNSSFLLFLGVILLWMILSFINFYNFSYKVNFIIQSVYWISLLNIAIVFLNFIYQLLERKHDFIYYIVFMLNTLTILSRYFLYPINYSEPNFWRLSSVGVATFMSTVFSLPLIWGSYLIFRQYKLTENKRVKKQLKYVLIGITLAGIISYFSEYIIPVFIPALDEHSFMYIAILILVLFLVVAVTKEKFLNVEMEYIYEELFLHSNKGILLIDKYKTIICVNNAAKSILGNSEINKGMKISEFIEQYQFNEDYYKKEITITIKDELRYLNIWQFPIKTSSKSTIKLLEIIDITKDKLTIKAENDRLMEQSCIDPLTSFYNKRYLNDLISGKTPLTKNHLVLIFIDVDDFKNINDNLGHLIGDDILRQVSKNIKKCLRDNEKVIRYGGDEFLIILEETSVKDAYLIAKRIQSSVNSMPLKECNYKRNLTLSLGISGGDSPINILIDNADKAMYYSKVQGKNQCTIYDENIENYYMNKIIL
ncbi:GGDEF domain-containing protein [Clostridium malenominatum]|uniref:GGDEF domain-containing protein n=2 Tax=Clostridium malenominatum TaxID=1539 RepID=A0ABP3U1M6_9CLOT